MGRDGLSLPVFRHQTDSMTKLIKVVCGVLTLLAVSIVAFKNAAFVVGPAEEAFVLRNEQVVRQYGPGLAWKIPFRERSAFIQARTVRQVGVEVEDNLADGSQCGIAANITYRVSDARRALDWRLANELDVGKNTSNAQERSDYAEPSRVFHAALRDKLLKTSSADAAAGALEDWIAGFARANSETASVDGTLTIQVEPIEVSCSHVWPPKKCSTVYVEDRRRFAAADIELTEDATAFPVDISIEAILGDQRRISIEGLEFGFKVSDQELLYQTVRDERRAAARMSVAIADILRRSFGQLDRNEVSAHDFGIDSAKVQAVASQLGLSLVAVDISNARFMLGEEVCE